MANLGCGCFCWALPRSLFALFLCWMAKRISGWGICVSPFVVCVCVFFCAIDLPSYMTTGVHVDVILNCFFSCKDRASERDRPYQRKKTIDLDNATRQLHQLSCILDSCTISASYEVSKAQKALLLLPRTEKGSSSSSEEHCANLPDPTHEDVLQEH